MISLVDISSVSVMERAKVNGFFLMKSLAGQQADLKMDYGLLMDILLVSNEGSAAVEHCK